MLSENYSFSSCTLSSKINRRYSKRRTKNKYVCLIEIIWLMTMKMRLKMKNRSHIYDIYRPRPRHGHKYNKCKICLIIMMVICTKQNISNIWCSIHEKLGNTKAELKKSPAYKKVCIPPLFQNWKFFQVYSVSFPYNAIPHQFLHLTSICLM